MIETHKYYVLSFFQILTCKMPRLILYVEFKKNQNYKVLPGSSIIIAIYGNGNRNGFNGTSDIIK